MKNGDKFRSGSDIFYCMTDYWDFVQQIRFLVNETGIAYYGWDDKRAALHDEMCRALGVTKEQTKEITDNLDKFSRIEEFWDAMLQLKKSNAGKIER